ncbi:MAG TPA: alanine--tRNA ligase, partial [Erythrobacter sp.]|nr:alanine--tRNA ligase [Erythrobacter sp.]
TEMGQAYPELQRGQALIEEVLEREETQFRRTLDKGLKLLDEATGTMGEGGTLDGQTAFKLYDTYGFPYDLTEDALRSRGITVDKGGFDAAMEQQKAAARAAWKGSGQSASEEVWFDIADAQGSTEFTGYNSTTGEAEVVAIVKDGAQVDSAGAGDEVVVLTNQTPFYGESGGQTGDAGRIWTPEGFEFAVETTNKPLGRLHTHVGRVAGGSVKVGDAVHLEVDAERRDRIRANHSATHLVHAALRNRLGDHVTQKGSLVSEDRFRFDFSHPKPLGDDDIAAIEVEVNEEIRANEQVGTRLMTPDDAV